jgi:hypothetical protein
MVRVPTWRDTESDTVATRLLCSAKANRAAQVLLHTERTCCTMTEGVLRDLKPLRGFHHFASVEGLAPDPTWALQQQM